MLHHHSDLCGPTELLSCGDLGQHAFVTRVASIPILTKEDQVLMPAQACQLVPKQGFCVLGLSLKMLLFLLEGLVQLVVLVRDCLRFVLRVF